MDDSKSNAISNLLRDGEMDIPLAHLPKYTDSPKNVVDIWLEKFYKGILTPASFKDHWRIWVPKFYSSEEPGLVWAENEAGNEVLINTLERFIANGDFEEKIKKFHESDCPPSVCGKVFKMGEPTYSCRECGTDYTCVLCVSCFKNSTHKHHSYKMGASTGGGCCDCGDVEAWSSDPFCDIHLAGTQVKKDVNVFEESMAERTKLVFQGILKYAFQILTLEHSPGLPHDLVLKEAEQDPLSFLDTPDIYCTVLYNDEVHTFEQVINTLTKVIRCQQKDAIEYVTNIDKEGRAVVKLSVFQQCQELKTEIERFTSRHGNQPLKVEVVHNHVIAHQLFAMTLLRWMQRIVTISENFRRLFTEVSLSVHPPDTSVVEGIMLRDSQLWKAARTHWHRLLISGMLMEYDSKKALATVFTKNYGSIMKDFIRDDHDHSFSIASLSVQLFTVPTLSHHLIAKQEALFILLNTFVSECARKCNSNGRLEFERNAPNQAFKRAQYILYDLRYLFSAVPKPEQWTDELRKGFLQGLSMFLNLLTFMQGMDSVTRQVVQHMEFEPEWESAFNLYIKLSSVITLVTSWCGSDQVVLIKAFRSTLRKLHENPLDVAPIGEVRELVDHSASCLQYDVATQPVSIHLPLSRFLVGLYLSLEKHELTFDSPAFQSILRPSPEQIIEPVLRTQVMIAQVHAGMWRRNGYSLLNQLYFYHNVRCRTEMLDRDVVMLQIGASLIQSDEFMIHLLNKFNLLAWADNDFEETSRKSSEEDSMRVTISLVEELLSLLVTILGERHIPGVGCVTNDDRVKKEIIQQLCIKPLSHSELSKTLPDDANHETGMERVIDEVAVFRKPNQASGKGVYELKAEFYDRYNMYFYHYTREELSKSEEEQRKRKRNANELECCPPPELIPLTDSFTMLPNLLQCDVMLHVMKTVLDRSLNLRARSFSEHQLQKVLHLIGYALHEEKSKRYPYMIFSEKAGKWNIEKLIDELTRSARVEAHREILTWTLNKFRQLRSCKESVEEQVVGGMSHDDMNQTGDASSGCSKTSKELRSKMVAEKRAKIMAQMAAMQKSFMKENAKLFEDTASSVERVSECDVMMELESEEKDPVALGPGQTPRHTPDNTYTCILCQEDGRVAVDGPSLVLSAFVQKSTVHAVGVGPAKTDEVLVKPMFLPTSLRPQPHTSTCGHVMHGACWAKYFDNVIAKENRRPYRLRQPSSFEVEKQEFLCPLCECLSNTVLPLVPPLAVIKPPRVLEHEVTFERFIDGLNVCVAKNKKVATVVCPPATTDSDSRDTDEESDERANSLASRQMSRYNCSTDVVCQELGSDGASFTSLFSYDNHHVVLSDLLTEMLFLFAQAAYTNGLNVNPSMDPFVPIMAWNSCYYTILSTDCLLRQQDKCLFGEFSIRQKDCLENLCKLSGVLSATWKQTQDVSTHALYLLTMILSKGDNEESPCLLDWDCFALVVHLTCSLPNFFARDVMNGLPTGGLLEFYIFKLMLLAQITKILLTSPFEVGMSEMETDESDLQNKLSNDESELLLSILSEMKKVTNQHVDVSQLNVDYVWSCVKQGCVPFLRCCSIFFHFLTGVPHPTCLAERGGDTFDNLCKYLGLSTKLSDLIDVFKSKDLFINWVKHKRIAGYLTSDCIPREPRPVSSFVSLPNDYSELINLVSTFTCPNSEREDSRYPTMCLVCGEMLCSQSYCCQQEVNKVLVGACTYHAHRCGANTGVFLRVRECEILLLAPPNRGCFLSPPYLDRYGETDQGLRRGNPLTLCPERYRKLKLLWLSHGLREEIARGIESNSNIVTTQWQHF